MGYGQITNQNSEMVHRVAMAIDEADGATASAYDLARAAIEAMREPSEGQYKAALEFGLSHMARHGVDGLTPFKDSPPLRETMEGMYRAMLDAALGEAAK